MHVGHAREKPHLLICACLISDLGLIKNKLRFLLYMLLLALRNNEFTYHGLCVTLLSQFHWQFSFPFFYSLSSDLPSFPNQSDHLPSFSVSLSFHSLLTNQGFSPFLSNQSNPLSPNQSNPLPPNQSLLANQILSSLTNQILSPLTDQILSP